MDENSNTARHHHNLEEQRHQEERERRPNNLPLLTSNSRDRSNNNNNNSLLLLQTDIDEEMAVSPLPSRSLFNRSPANASTTTIVSDFELSVLERFDQLLATLGTRSSSGWCPSFGFY